VLRAVRAAPRAGRHPGLPRQQPVPDLRPSCAVAQQHGQEALRVLAHGDAERATADTEWVLVLQPDVLAADPRWSPPPRPARARDAGAPLWTDDFSSPWPVLR
jgi:hypothetical protein